MGILFNKKPYSENQSAYAAAGSGGFQQLADLLENTTGTDTIDVVNDFQWTLTPTGSLARQNAPYVFLKEYYMYDSYINQLLKSYNLKTYNPAPGGTNITALLGILSDLTFLKEAGNSDMLYEGMYDIGPENYTGFSYKFPYFDNPLTTTNTWTEKSTYNEIVQRQIQLAPYKSAEIIGTASADIVERIIENIVPASIAQFLKDTGTYNKIAEFATPITSIQQAAFEGSIKLLQGDLSGMGAVTAEFAPEIFASTIGLAGSVPWIGGIATQAAKWLPQIVRGVKAATQNLAQGMTRLKRFEELMNIATKSPIASIDSDPVIDKPHIWSSTTPRVINISFPLFNTEAIIHDVIDKHNNTTDLSWCRNIIRNWELCYLLTYQNLYNKRNLFTGIPPVFYEIDIPGMFYTKAGYVNSLTILNVGNIRNMFLPVGDPYKNTNVAMSVNVPDAYVVNMTITDFFMPSRNFFDSINNSENRGKVTSRYASSFLKSENDIELPPKFPPGPARPPTAITPAGGVPSED